MSTTEKVKHICSGCQQEKDCIEVRVVDSVPLSLESSEYFCSPGCMAMFIASSPHSFMLCEGCGRNIRAYYEDLKQISLVKGKMLCLDCYYKIILRFGQPLDQLIHKPPIAAINKHFHGTLLKDAGYKVMGGGKAIKGKEHLIKLIPKLIELYRQRIKIIIKENPNETYTVWLK